MNLRKLVRDGYVDNNAMEIGCISWKKLKKWIEKSENGYHASRAGLRIIPSGKKSNLSKEGFAFSPFGQCFYFSNQKEFCELNNLQRSNFSRMISGEYLSSKGWTTCENWGQ